VLGGNLGGLTSALLGLDNGETAKKLQLDALFPVNAQPTPYKRCIDGSYGFGAYWVRVVCACACACVGVFVLARAYVCACVCLRARV